jgi:hypothetical protein
MYAPEESYSPVFEDHFVTLVLNCPSNAFTAEPLFEEAVTAEAETLPKKLSVVTFEPSVTHKLSERVDVHAEAFAEDEMAVVFVPDP